jgi:hypothetical protein
MQRGIIRTASQDVEETIERARQAGLAVYLLPPSGIRDRDDFFNAVRETLPLDPPLVSNRSWDALSDSLWGGLDALSAGHVVIVWANSDVMARAAPVDYETALEILTDIADTLAERDFTDRPKEVSIILA